MDPIVDSEEIAAGRLTRAALRWNYTAVLPNIYLPRGTEQTPLTRTAAAFLWSGRKGILAGRAAAYIYGVPWAVGSAPIEMIAKHRRRVPGVEIHDERVADDEIRTWATLPVTSPARTALDIGRRLPRARAVAVLDALAAETDVTAAEVQALAARYAGMRGIPAAREAASLMDGGAQSREESALRLYLIDSGLPRPTTDLHIEDRLWSTRIAMGWEWAKVGVSVEPGGPCEEYWAVQRLKTEELIQRLGWIHIRSHPLRAPHSVRFQVRAALTSRGLHTRGCVPTSSAADR